MRSLRSAWLVAVLGCGPLVPGDSGGEDATEGPSPTTNTGPETMPGSSTTSTTSTPETTSGGSDDSTGCATECTDSGQDSLSFVFPCDGAGFGLAHCQPPHDECNLWLQDCPEGEKCQPWANDGGSDWNSTRCSPIDPANGQPGEACMVEGSGVSGVDSCGLGSMCWGVDPKTNEGTCVAMCTNTPDAPICEDPTRACAMTNDGYLIVCLVTCDPLDSACPDGEGCYPVAGDDLTPDFVCAPTGTGITIDDRHPTHCAPGTVDVGTDQLSSCREDADPCCATLCDMSAPACEDGLTCTTFYDLENLPPFPDLSLIGLCLG